ncbi:MAG: hypothetical protein DWI29_01720, partial [Planctomycetota bacterium]
MKVSVRGTHLVRRGSVASTLRNAESSGGDIFAAFLAIAAFAVGHLACLFNRSSCPPTERRTYVGEPLRRRAPDTAAKTLFAASDCR